MQFDYLINSDIYSEGGYAQFYHIVNYDTIGFKEFKNKKKAIESYNIQKLLSQFDLAPKVYGTICKLNFSLQVNDQTISSNWGYITEKAKIIEDSTNQPYSFRSIQLLVNEIYKKTKLKFWDCHYYNIGLVKRKRSHKLVCIDTGNESFNGYANAWGMNQPGPKCGYCNKYQCKCSEI